MDEIKVEWVEEIPAPLPRPSPYDPIAEGVREGGKVAKIPVGEMSVHTLASRLRKRYPDLDVAARKEKTGERFIFIALKKKGKK